MHFSIIALLLPALVLAEPESGSYCNKPQNELFLGEATQQCCAVAGGQLNNKVCYGLRGSQTKCPKFYNCCINSWHSANKSNDLCR